MVLITLLLLLIMLLLWLGCIAFCGVWCGCVWWCGVVCGGAACSVMACGGSNCGCVWLRACASPNSIGVVAAADDAWYDVYWKHGVHDGSSLAVE